MKPEVFTEWLRIRGYNIVRTNTSLWYDPGFRVYQAIPYHWIIDPQQEELDDLLSMQKAIALRYSTPLEAPVGKISYHVIVKGQNFNIKSISNRKARQDIKRGLKYADIYQISFSRLAAEGWNLRSKVLTRQGRQGYETQIEWELLCRSAASFPGFEAWGAIHKGELISSLLAFICDDCYTLIYQQSSPEHFKSGVNNAIIYTVIKQALERSEISQVFISLHSLDAPSSVDAFKFRMGFNALPVRQRVVFNSKLQPFINRGSHAIIQRVLNLLPNNSTLAKAEGMLSFYLEGQRPLSEQNWPDILLGRKEELIHIQ